MSRHNRTRIAVTAALVILASPVIFSGIAPSATFERVYGGAARDHAASVVETEDGGYMVVGQAPSLGKDPCLLKTDSLGNTLWVRELENGGEQYSGFSVTRTSDGGYAAAISYWCCPRQARILVIKTDRTGKQQWSRLCGKEEKEYSWGNSIQETSDGGFIVTGGAGLAPYVVKLNAQGNIEWERTYSLGNENPCRSARQTNDGGYVAAGGQLDMFLVKTNSRGDVAWARTYGGGERDEAYWVEPTRDGGYILTGYTESYGAGDKDVYLVKTDSKGKIVWTRTYGTRATEIGYSVQATSDMGFIIVGVTNPVGGEDSDVYLVKTDSLGSPQWTRTYGGTLNEKAYTVRQIRDGGYVFAGYTASCGWGDFDMYLVRTDSLGLVTGQRDAAMASIESPPAVVYAGSPCEVGGTVLNKSNQCLSYTVVASIEGIYEDTVKVTGHPPQTPRGVTFKKWSPTRGESSSYILNIYTDLEGDADPANDFTQKEITIR